MGQRPRHAPRSQISHHRHRHLQRPRRSGDPHSSPLIDLTNAKQLFVDDWLIENSTSLSRSFHTAVKHASNPLLKPKRPWEIPADRFVSLRPYDWLQPGAIETKPLKLLGTDLLINAEVPPKNLRIELADADGRPLPGFESSASIPERHDPLRYRIRWKSENQSLSLKDAPLDSPIILRITLSDGDLFSFTVLP